MLFTTSKYAVFFAVAFAVSWALAALARRFAPGSRAALWPRLAFLLAASYFFYAAWDWRYLPLIFGSSTVDFFLARAIHATRRDGTDAAEGARRRKLLLVVTVALNLGFLGFFKYWDFALENALALRSVVTGAEPAITNAKLLVLLPPVGISFFTFESMSYVIDVYRGDLEAHESYFRYLLFVSFFPHLVAGPIVRPRDLLPQLERPPVLTRAGAGEAMFLIAIGLVKKLILSDQLATNLVDRVFQRPDAFSALEVLCGVYGYAAQIYCDFSGYTDIAIGSALLLGVRFPKNFDAPYKATDLADFWHRWHISLSTWLRDYLYIPLGGSRGGAWKTYRNLLITMVLGGLWHGASWNFVIWGALHGVGLAATRWFQRVRGEKRAARARHVTSAYREGPSSMGPRAAPNPDLASLGRAPEPPAAAATPRLTFGGLVGWFFTFHYVCFAWIFFRAKTLRDVRLVLGQLATLTDFHPNLPPFVVGLLSLALASHFLPEAWYAWLRNRFANMHPLRQALWLYAIAGLLHEAASVQQVPFVYFQF